MKYIRYAGRLYRQANKQDALTKYAKGAFGLFLRQHQEPVEQVVRDVARLVGRHAKRLGITEDEVSRWLQSAYGDVWVRETGLNPVLDLKDVRKIIFAEMRK